VILRTEIVIRRSHIGHYNAKDSFVENREEAKEPTREALSEQNS